MTFLPLIERELAARARQKGTYWVRVAVGLASVMVCVPQLLTADGLGTGGAAGNWVFNCLIRAVFVMCCTACFATSDSISSEVREGTLGLLFLTRLKGFDVILGKLLSNGLLLLCTVATMLPVLMIPVLTGGVAAGEAFRKAAVLFDTLFLCLAMGLNSSAFERESLKATGRTLALLIMSVLLTAILPEPFRLLSPLRALALAGDPEYRAAAAQFWTSLLLIQSLAWLFLWGANKRLRQAVTEQETAPVEAKLASARRIRRPSDSSAPIGWAIGRGPAFKPMLWAAALLAIVFNILAYRIFFMGSLFGQFGAFWLIENWLHQTLFNAISAALFAWAASRFPIQSRRTGELELLLTTPLGAQTLVDEHWRVLRNALRWPILAMVLAVLLQFALGIRSRLAFGGVEDWLPQYALSCTFSIVSTVVSVGVICRVGLWLGMRATSQSRAIISTVLLAKGVPYLIGLLWALLMTVNALWTRGASSYYYMALIPQIGILVFYSWITRVAKRGLSRDLAGANEGERGLHGALAGIREGLASNVAKFRQWKVT
jgi:hypothetical protein